MTGARTHDPLLERGSPLCPCERCRFTNAADEAIRTGEIVELDGFALVPDIVMAEAAANGDETPPTWTMHRITDGRSVHVYRLPEAWTPR